MNLVARVTIQDFVQDPKIDIANDAEMNMSPGLKLKQPMSIIGKSVPFKPNMSKIAAMLNIGRNNIADYLLYMEEVGMIAHLRSETSGARALGKVDKIYLENTNLMHQLRRENQNLGNLRETFFLNQTITLHHVSSSP
jgi:predicted AAA+ superfamily ATPase